MNVGCEPGKTFESSATPLSDIFSQKGQKFTYIYDFGDDWTHLITLEKILPEEIVNNGLFYRTPMAYFHPGCPAFQLK